MIDLNNKNILITGGAGFIGSNFIELIDELYKNLSIVNLDKMGVGSRVIDSQYLRCKYYEYKVDISEYQSFDFLKNMNFDYIFHFAAESHVDRSISNPSAFVENNVIGTTNLLEYIRQFQPKSRLINISTDECYGHLELGEAPFTEDSPLLPRSPYSASKTASDLIVNSYVHTFGIDAVTTRCCNNFGKHQADEKFIPTVIRHLINNEPIPVYGTGKNIREWIYVEDHNRSLLEIAEIGEAGKVYNIGSGIELTNLEVIDQIAKNIGITPKIEFVEDRKGHDFRYAISSKNYNRKFDLKTLFGAHTTLKFYENKYADA
jgi:dTDP-glucose 4,6-dehydratase